MSRFDLTFAIEAAALAYAVRPGQADADARATAPLLGKEEALLAALRAGEAAHDALLEELLAEDAVEQDVTGEYRRSLSRIAKHLDKALSEIAELPSGARRFLGWRAIAIGLVPKSSFSGRQIIVNGEALPLAVDDDAPADLTGAAQSYQDTVERLRDAAAMAAWPTPRGRRAGISQDVGAADVHLEPLREFLRPLRAFWLEATGTPFTTHIGGGVKKPAKGEDDKVGPVSAPAKLAWAAMRKLTVGGHAPYTQTMLHQSSRAK